VSVSGSRRFNRENQKSPVFSPCTSESKSITSNFNYETSQKEPSVSFLPDPICVLKIELDGENIEEIRVYDGDIPAEIVNKFSDQFNLSDNAKYRLLEQIHNQIRIDQEEQSESYKQKQY